MERRQQAGLLNLSEEGFELLKKREGLSLELYYDSAGVATIGYGHAMFDPPFLAEIDQATAEALFKDDLHWAKDAVRRLVNRALHQHEYDALVSFVFNVGVHAFRTSTLLRKLNEGSYEGASEEFSRWVWAGGRKLAGLEKRRAAEQAQFRGEIYRAGIECGCRWCTS